MSIDIESLAGIRPEHVPPIALKAFNSHRILTENGGSPLPLADMLKSALYPGHHRYNEGQRLPANLQPFYRVEVTDSRQAILANLLRPETGEVEIVQSPEVRTETTRPLVQRVRNFLTSHRSETALASISSVMYGSTILLNNLLVGALARGAITGDLASPMNENYAGLGLIVAGAVTGALSLGLTASRSHRN